MFPLDEESVKSAFEKFAKTAEMIYAGEFYKIIVGCKEKTADGKERTVKVADNCSSGGCFGSVFTTITESLNKIDKNPQFILSTAKAIIEIDLQRRCSWSFVWMTEEQFHIYLDYVKDHLGIPFKYSTCFNDSSKTLKLQLQLSKLTSRNQIKMLVFWIRTAYKYPANLFLYESLKLWNKHPEEELYNLITVPPITLGTAYIFNVTINFTLHSKMVELAVLREKLKEPISKFLSTNWDPKERYNPLTYLNNIFCSDKTPDYLKLPEKTTVDQSSLYVSDKNRMCKIPKPEVWFSVENLDEKMEDAYQHKLKQGYYK